jgi:hypothetical protein
MITTGRAKGAALVVLGTLLVAACGSLGGSGSTAAPISAAAPVSSATGGAPISTTPAPITTTPAPVSSSPVPVSTSPVSRAPAPTQESSCTLPLTHDTYNGFHIAVPANWGLSTLNGQIEVTANPSNTEGVIVYPALQTQGLTPTGFFTAYLTFLEQQSKSQGLTLTATMQPDRDGLPVASFAEPDGSTQIEGEATLAVLPLHTQLSSAELVFLAYFSPASNFTAASGMLSSIAHCYGSESASLFRVFQDQVFTYIMPTGWTVFDEETNGIDLHGPAGEDVSYTLLAGVSASEVDSPQSMINFYLSKLNFQSVDSLWSTSTPSETNANGGTSSLGYEEFTANLGGAVHGLIYANISTGGGVTSGVVRLALTSASEWNAENSGVIQMAGAVQHKFTQDLEQLAQANRQFQEFSGQVADFDDTLNSQQLVQDPSTGTYYEAPYSSYVVDGPDGPGYYDGQQRLNPVQQS